MAISNPDAHHNPTGKCRIALKTTLHSHKCGVMELLDKVFLGLVKLESYGLIEKDLNDCRSTDSLISPKNRLPTFPFCM